MRQELGRGVLPKDHNAVHAAKGREHERTVVFSIHWARLSLEPLHRCIRIQPHDQVIPERGRLCEIGDVTAVEHVKASIRKYDDLAPRFPCCDLRFRFFPRKDALLHKFPCVFFSIIHPVFSFLSLFDPPSCLCHICEALIPLLIRMETIIVPCILQRERMRKIDQAHVALLCKLL